MHPELQTLTVYAPESRLRSPLSFARSIGNDLAQSKDIAWCLFVRDLKAYYRDSYLGGLWAFIPVLSVTLMCTLAFQSKVIAAPELSVSYPVFVVIGYLLWQSFMDSINGPIQAIQVERSTFAKVSFPPEAVILAKLGEVIFNCSIKLLLILGILCFFKVHVSQALYLAPIAACSLIALGTFIGVLLAPISLLYDDFSRLLNVSYGYWFFCTPIIYSAPNKGEFAAILNLNPVTPLLVSAREMFLGVKVSHVHDFFLVSIFSLIGIIGAWILFKLSMPYVIERKP